MSSTRRTSACSRTRPSAAGCRSTRRCRTSTPTPTPSPSSTSSWRTRVGSGTPTSRRTPSRASTSRRRRNRHERRRDRAAGGLLAGRRPSSGGGPRAALRRGRGLPPGDRRHAAAGAAHHRPARPLSHPPRPLFGGIAGVAGTGRGRYRRHRRYRRKGAEAGETAGEQGGGAPRRRQRAGGRQEEGLVRAGERREARLPMMDAVQPEAPRQHDRGGAHGGSYAGGSLKLGSASALKSVSRSQPSFSSLMCWMAMALALASRSGSAWYSDTQQRKALYDCTRWFASLKTSMMMSLRKSASDDSLPVPPP